MKAKDKITKDILELEYLINKKTLKKISQEYGFSHSRLKQLAKEYHITTRKTKDYDIKLLSIRKGFGEISGTYWCFIKSGAKTRNLEFNITIEYAWDLFLKQDRKCSLSGLLLTFPEKLGIDSRWEGSASLDRKNSKIGYIEGNVQWIHKKINTMKMDMTDDELIYYCHLISLYRKN